MRRKKKSGLNPTGQELVDRIARLQKDVAGDVLPVQMEDENESPSSEMFADLVQRMSADFEIHRQLFTLRAKLHKVFYDELRSAGFSKEEAMEILKARQM